MDARTMNLFSPALQVSGVGGTCGMALRLKLRCNHYTNSANVVLTGGVLNSQLRS